MSESTGPRRIALIFGTRPEAIKMAPVLFELKRRPDEVTPIVIVTSQHVEMLEQALELFGIQPDYDLQVMRHDQDLFDISAGILSKVRQALQDSRPDTVLVQGDTSTTFCSALAAFYSKIAVGHIEAGLRTRDRFDPFPEEMNRRLTGALADLHFAPTEWARRNLLGEGVPDERILVTGNTSIDSFQWVLERVVAPQSAALDEKFGWLGQHGRMLLVTAHRRESFGEPLERVMSALCEILERNPDTCVAFPVHLNPTVQRTAQKILGDIDRAYLMDPLSYEEFAYLVKRSYLVLSDSGGIQEEAPSLGKPVLVLRRTTERPEGVEAGTNTVVGTDRDDIVRAAERFLHDRDEYERVAQIRNPFGDGKAARRIVDRLLQRDA